MGEYVNSRQARFNQSYVSCGVMEVHHLPDLTAAQTLFSIVNSLYHKANPRPAAFVIFSDLADGANSRGELLAKKITELGEARTGLFYESPKALNPKTGNVIRLWMWQLNHETMRAWYQDELANRITAE